MFDRTLPLTEQGGQRALAAEAPDDPPGCVHSIFHGAENNDFFVIKQDPSTGSPGAIDTDAGF
jgi:hypothetical protein